LYTVWAKYGYLVQQLSAGVIYVDGFRGCGMIAGSCISIFPWHSTGNNKTAKFCDDEIILKKYLYF
jgi:hypothetical protein